MCSGIPKNSSSKCAINTKNVAIIRNSSTEEFLSCLCLASIEKKKSYHYYFSRAVQILPVPKTLLHQAVDEDYGDRDRSDIAHADTQQLPYSRMRGELPADKATVDNPSGIHTDNDAADRQQDI